MKAHIQTEQRFIWKHALTVFAGQLAAVLSMVIDTLVAGRYSHDALAALSVAHALNLSITVSLVGVLNVLLPIYAQSYGAGHYKAVGKTLHQGVYLVLGLSLLAISVLLFSKDLLALAQVPPALMPSITQYLAVQAIVIPLYLLFRIYALLNQALGKPWFVTWLQIVTLLVKIPLSIVFTIQYGLVGCALATVTVTIMGLAIGAYLLATHSNYRPFAIWRRLDAPNWKELTHYVRLGFPAGLSQLVEVTSFTLIALLTARLGITASAAHQIASSITAMLFMVPISYGIAATARVSYWIGKKNNLMVAALIQQSLGFGLLLSSVLGLLIFLSRHWLASWFSSTPEIVTLASTLLGFVALYHIPDSLQIVGMFLLRCYHITFMPLMVYGVFLWGIGLGGGYYLAYLAPASYWTQTPQAFWLTAIIALSVVALWFSVTLLKIGKKNSTRLG